MRSLLVILFITALTLVQARTLTGSREDYRENYQDSSVTTRSGSHPHSPIWPCDVADYPQSYPLLHKVEKRMQGINSEETRNQIRDYVVRELRQCISEGKMDRHCVGRSIGYAMAFINRQWSHQQSNDS